MIPARDAEATLPATLAALEAQAGAPAFEVIVVDDASRDATPALVTASSARLVRGRGEGPAAARNRGVREASGRLIAFTDADCAPTPGWLAAGWEASRDADLVQGRVQPPPAARVGPFDRHITVLAEYGLYETANLFITRDLFDRLGGFESILIPRSGKELGEDIWLGWRARRAGAQTAFANDALVHHAVFPRSAREFVAEHARRRFFPELARRIPELRDSFFHRRVFLNERTARFDLALAGAVTAVATRRLAPLVLAAPHALLVQQDARRSGRIALAGLAADGVSAAALALGSARSRSMLL